mgnify:CR=1 FL=1
MISIKQIPVLNDNYIYIAVDESTKKTACIDPAISINVIDFLEKENLSLDFILNTHHHFDHVGGNLELKEKYRCKIIGNKYDASRIPGIDILMTEGDTMNIGESSFKVLEVSGHTKGHISFYFSEDLVLFCGDTLFSLGCGKLFEGSARQMVSSLNKIKSLPERTKIYCAHEYTEANSKFAAYLSPDDKLLSKKINEIKKKRLKSIPTIPSLLFDEKRFNPFLKYDDKQFVESIGLKFSSNEENFGTIRRMKDEF